MTDKETKPPLDFPELEAAGGGAPVDEFAGVPSPRRRHPFLALGAAALAVFLIYRLHDDLLFALSHSAPKDVGDARSLATRPSGELPINEYVRMTGMPDRESGVIIDTAGSWQFTQFFRVLGTRSRIFVNRIPDPLPAEHAERDVFVGRLIRFKDLSFQDAIRKHFANRVTATHFFAPQAVRDAVKAAAGGPMVVVDLLGEKVSLAANDEISIDVPRPADLEVVLPKAKFADAAAARAAVEKQGATVLDDAVKAPDGKSLSLIVTFPDDKRDQGMHAVSELDYRILFRPVRATHTARVADLSVAEQGAGGALVVKTAAGQETVDIGKIVAMRTMANVQIPDDAVLLREGDRPREHLKSVVVAAFLLAFALINLLALRGRA